ncbi:MAG: acyl-CoA dehydrogenase family protein [Parashewanella sp.]
MYPYKAPLDDMEFLLDEVFDANSSWKQFPYVQDNLDLETASAILQQAATLSSDMLFPMNRAADEQGVSFANGAVSTPKGFKSAYAEFAAGGWVGFCGDPQFDGMGMPKMLGVLVEEMNYSASNSFTLYNSLTAGAALCINAHANDELKQIYLPKMYSGEWSGAMAMTESGAGSDLSRIRTLATKQDDGSYLVSGSKIFITAGEHDLTENIIHLVLTKTPNNNRLSLFLVPKVLPNKHENNRISAASIEHKMGIHASATCVMNYDDSVGFLVGEEGKGLSCMFTMMNYERLAIGIQGLGNTEMAYQMAAQYAKEREQGYRFDAETQKQVPCTLIHHADVRRMLLMIRCFAEAGRALAVYTGLQLDIAKFSNSEQQTLATKYSQLLTPVTKAFFTDRGLDMSVMAQQVFGGHGYIRETGIEQIVRDTRIAQIYEGTNGIQAHDFLGRKIVSDNCVTLKTFIDELKLNMENFKVNAEKVVLLNQRFESLVSIADNITQRSSSDSSIIGSNCVNYLDAFGYCIYGYFWLLMQHKSQPLANELTKSKQLLCDFYFSQILPKADAHILQLQHTKDEVMTMPETFF